jgi:hypothetical protein
MSWARREREHEHGKSPQCERPHQCRDSSSFTDAEAAAAIKDGVTKDGMTRMIAFGGKLTDEEIKALVAYVRTLKK